VVRRPRHRIDTGGTRPLVSVDGTSLTVSERSFFLKTGSGDHDTTST